MKIYLNKNKFQGFTLIELLVVIAIIGLLSSVVMASLNSARIKTRDTIRKENLTQLRTALTAYFNDHGSYPSTATAWKSSSPNDAVGNGSDTNYVPGLAPTYIPTLPKDPIGGGASIPICTIDGWQRSILYRSNDGTGYKLLDHCAPEGPMSSSDTFYDPYRATWAWMVCSGNDCSD